MDCSESVSILLEYERRELLQKTIDNISYHGDEVNRLFQQYLDEGKLSGEYVLMAKDRTPVPIRYRAFAFSDGCLAAIWEPIRDWRQAYMAALVEVDPDKLKEKIEIAFAAIRAHGIQSDASESAKERQSIQDAKSVLQVLVKHSK